MSTEYDVKSPCIPEELQLSIYEHSGVLDLVLSTYLVEHKNKHSSRAIELTITVADRCKPEDMAEIGLRLLQTVLYNCGDPEKVRTWLHKRVNEVDGGTRTEYPKL